MEALIYKSILEDYESLYRFCNPQQRKALKLYQGQLQYEEGTEPELDTKYFTDVWKKIGTFRQPQMQSVLREVFGTQIDWLNIMWIYRAKRFFNQNAVEIYAMLIPVHYKLKKTEIRQMAEAQQVGEIIKIVSNTAYFNGKEALVQIKDEISYHEVMKKMFRRDRKSVV